MNSSLNLIPMAGLGRRFKEAGVEVAKPLIEIDSGVPMIVKAASCLPRTTRTFFVCREEHVKQSGIDKTLAKNFPGCVVKSITHDTQGQVSTCLLARKEISESGWLNIGACDSYMTYSMQKFLEVAEHDDVDALIWTSRNNPSMLQNPLMYGWVRTEGLRATAVSVKKTISESPENDHAVIGVFSFRRGVDFLDCADRLIAEGRRIDGEFYIDNLMNVAVENGLRVEVFEVDKYICWGTPLDLKIYKFWKSFFSSVLDKR
jgi:dTDP-glucose pyrophosphorylase